MITFVRPREAIISSLIGAVLPNSAIATIIGPTIVPKLLIPPPRFTRLDPDEGSPSAIANGLAAVCCKEKPSATINSPPSIPAKVLPYTAIIITTAPIAENSNP